MVLFNDTLPPKPKTLFSKCLTWIIRLLLLAIGLCILFVGCLNLLQGNGEAQKNGLSKTISHITQKETHIGTLNAFELFPEISLSMENIKNGVFSDQQISIQALSFRAPGSLLINKNGVFRDIDIQNITFLKDNKIIRSIESVQLMAEDDNNDPFLSLRFSRPFIFELRLGLTALSPTDYKLSTGFPFSIHWEHKGISREVLGRFFAEDGTYYLTGTGKNIDASLAPFFSVNAENIECFLGEITIRDYKIIMENTIIKTNSNTQLHSIFPFEMNVFEKDITLLDQTTDTLPVPERALIEKSECAPYLGPFAKALLFAFPAEDNS